DLMDRATEVSRSGILARSPSPLIRIDRLHRAVVAALPIDVAGLVDEISHSRLTTTRGAGADKTHRPNAPDGGGPSFSSDPMGWTTSPPFTTTRTTHGGQVDAMSVEAVPAYARGWGDKGGGAVALVNSR